MWLNSDARFHPACAKSWVLSYLHAKPAVILKDFSWLFLRIRQLRARALARGLQSRKSSELLFAFHWVPVVNR